MKKQILKPVFDPTTQPGFQSRFRNSPFNDFFGSAQWGIIEPAPPIAQPIADKNPVKRFNSLQSPNVIPARKK